MINIYMRAIHAGKASIVYSGGCPCMCLSVCLSVCMSAQKLKKKLQIKIDVTK